MNSNSPPPSRADAGRDDGQATARRGLDLIPEGGLANRLRVLASALLFAQEAEVPLRVHWMRTPDFNAGFSRLFEVEGLGFTLTEHGGSLVHKLAVRIVEKVLSATGVSVLGDAQTHPSVFDPSNLRRRLGQGRVLLRTNYPLAKAPQMYRLFVPVPPLRALIEQHAGEADKMVGVHLRRGDHAKATERSPLEGFVAAMQAELDARPDTHFFVATDDPPSLQALQQRFGPRLRHYPKRALARNDPLALEDAVVDLFTLARSRRLIGSYWSSFSDMAHDLGGQPYYVIGKGEVQPEPAGPATG